MAATCLTHPLDLLKNRMQMNETSTPITSLVSLILRNEGPRGLYDGLTASLVSEVASRLIEIGKFGLIYRLTP